MNEIQGKIRRQEKQKWGKQREVTNSVILGPSWYGVGQLSESYVHLNKGMKSTGNSIYASKCIIF